MLVLSRKPSEAIIIGSGIKITVLKVERNQVRIGIEAPKDLPILREELLRKATCDKDARGHDTVADAE